MSENEELQECQRLLDNLTDAVFLFDQQFALRYVNNAGELLLGGSARHFVGSSLDKFLTCDEIDVEAILSRTIDSGSAFAQRALLIELAGITMTVNFFVTPLLDGLRCNSILVEMQQVDRHLRIYHEEQLVAQQTASRLLLRGLAHEVKNPLGGIRGAAQLLDQELAGQFSEYTQVIIDESDRLQSLLDRMLGPNKLPIKRVVNIHKVLERVRQVVISDVSGKVRVVRDYDPSIPDLVADQDQIIQAVLNVVKNAAEAVGERGTITLKTRIHRQVTIANQRNRLAVRVDVVDDGPGVSTDLVSKIFYPLVTDRADGTGLGLSIAQSLINEHNGVIECSSEPGNTVFSIYLPLRNGNDSFL